MKKFIMLVGIAMLTFATNHVNASQMGLGFTATPLGSELVILRIIPTADVPVAVEPGASFWVDGGDNFNFHIALRALYRVYDVIDFENVQIHAFGGVQFTGYGAEAVDNELNAFLGMEVEYFLVERVSVFINSGLTVSLSDFPVMGNYHGTSRGLASGVILYF